MEICGTSLLEGLGQRLLIVSFCWQCPLITYLVSNKDAKNEIENLKQEKSQIQEELSSLKISKGDEIQALKDTIAATNDKLERAEHEKKTLKEINLSLLKGF